jgi:hypothetical protein
MLLINSPIHCITNMLSRSSSLGLLCGGPDIYVVHEHLLPPPSKYKHPSTRPFTLYVADWFHWKSIPILSPYLRLTFQRGSFSAVFPLKQSVQFSSSPYVLHDKPALFIFNWSPEQFQCVAVFIDRVPQRLGVDSFWLIFDSCVLGP